MSFQEEQRRALVGLMECLTEERGVRTQYREQLYSLNGDLYLPMSDRLNKLKKMYYRCPKPGDSNYNMKESDDYLEEIASEANLLIEGEGVLPFAELHYKLPDEIVPEISTQIGLSTNKKLENAIKLWELNCIFPSKYQPHEAHVNYSGNEWVSERIKTEENRIACIALPRIMEELLGRGYLLKKMKVKLGVLDYQKKRSPGKITSKSYKKGLKLKLAGLKENEVPEDISEQIERFNNPA